MISYFGIGGRRVGLLDAQGHPAVGERGDLEHNLPDPRPKVYEVVVRGDRVETVQDLADQLEARLAVDLEMTNIRLN